MQSSNDLPPQNTCDAFYDVIAAGVMHILGNALLIPYYRCDGIFPVDTGLENRLRDALARLTRAEPEEW